MSTLLWRELPLALLLVGLAASAALWFALAVPGRSFVGPLPAQSGSELQRRLRGHVEALAGAIGERRFDRPGSLERAAQYIEAQLVQSGLRVRSQPVDTYGEQLRNLEVELPGGDPAAPVLVVGAHYDSAEPSPGADDNASGVAVLLELARRLRGAPLRSALRLVAFVNEESPYFGTPRMGSWVYASAAAARSERIAAMLSIESVGYYSAQPGSQRYPAFLGWFYPDRGDFAAFVANPGSRRLLHRALGAFRDAARLPSQGIAAPQFVPGVSWSDQWAFWQHGYPALMVTGTAPFRNPHYHRASDTPETLHYPAMAELVLGLEAVLRRLAE